MLDVCVQINASPLHRKSVRRGKLYDEIQISQNHRRCNNVAIKRKLLNFGY